MHPPPAAADDVMRLTALATGSILMLTSHVRIRHAGVQSFDVRRAQERDRLSLSRMERQGLAILSDPQAPLIGNAQHINPPGGLEKYYRDNVIGGPGSFVIVAENFQSFGRAIVKKMVAEIASNGRGHADWGSAQFFEASP